MTLFVAVFDDHTSILIDAETETQASARAAELAEEAPAGIVPVARGAFAAELVWKSDEDPELAEEDDDLTVIPLDFTLDLLAELDALDPEKLKERRAAETKPAPPDLAPLAMQPVCGREAETGNASPDDVVGCLRAVGHDDAHEGYGLDGRRYEWTDA